ncbi:Arylsulfatase [Planctomycetes bacterium CA13]|uniref:Arylsulfatase n=1 Tax=Novipirellula herctigrandis TaxID=2527986 RepID=A0A5C5ZCX2_9BACT|nr:Arylsulfatase [Planctomycetes bacterium CA13]
MRSPTILTAVLAAMALVMFVNRPTSAEDRPNIVLIMVDDMGWSNIGCYGGNVETPNLDELAANGVRFNQFYNGARCCPTRATLMTGLHPHQVGVGHMVVKAKPYGERWEGKRGAPYVQTTKDREGIPYPYQGWLDTSIPTLPEILKAAGYGTYMTGKWHLANEKQETWPTQRGFDRFFGHLAGGSDFWKPNGLFRDNDPVEAEGERFYLTDTVSEEAIELLAEHDQQNDEQPFFLYLAYNAPHFPIQCMPEEFNKYRGRFKKGWDKLREEKLVRQKAMGLVPENTKLSPRPQPIPDWESLKSKKQDEMDAIMATYCGMIDRVDQYIGKLVEHLRSTGEMQNTVIFFLSDNGAEAESGPFGQFEFKKLGKYGGGGTKYGRGWATLSNSPCRDYKHFTHQGGVQTPLIVHWPAGIPGNRNGQILNQNGYLPDLVETCLDLGGGQRPKMLKGKAVPTADGVSLVAAMKGSDAPLHSTPVMIEHEGKCVARLGSWKLVKHYNQPWELYDIDHDFSELNDLVADYPEKAAELEKAYNEWAERCGVVDWDHAKDWSVYSNKKPKSNTK